MTSLYDVMMTSSRYRKSYNLRQFYSYTNLKSFICTKAAMCKTLRMRLSIEQILDFMAVLVQFYGLFYTKNGISQTFFLQS